MTPLQQAVLDAVGHLLATNVHGPYRAVIPATWVETTDLLGLQVVQALPDLPVAEVRVNQISDLAYVEAPHGPGPTCNAVPIVLGGAK